MFIGLLLVCAVVFAVVGADNFPSLITTNATLAIIIDREYTGEEYESIKATIEAYVVYGKREKLKHGGVNVLYYSWTSINLKREITAILSIASCADTWRLFKNAEEEGILHMAISESDCPRLPPDKAITVPLIKGGEELPQLLLDLRTTKTYKWNSAVVLYDTTLSRDQITRVVKSLTATARNLPENSVAVTLVKLETLGVSLADFRHLLNDTLFRLNARTLGRNFLAIVSYDIVEFIMEFAKSIDLVNTKNQWLYLISDTDYRSKNIDRFRQLLNEGDNVAFLYNTTVVNETCKGGLKCHAEEILESFTISLDSAIQDEFELASQVSDEEWEAIRPTKLDRRTFMLDHIKAHLLKNAFCDNCTSWSMKAGDTWGREYQQNVAVTNTLISVGSWRPIDGPSMVEELFPHIAYGFRNITLPMVTFHNPPWQIIRRDESGAMVYAGLTFDVIHELGRNLNFSYEVNIIPVANEVASNWTNSTAEISDIVTNLIPDRILDLVKNKSVLFGACAFTVTEEGKRFVNFTRPISTQTYTFLVARPRELSRALLFMSPFTGDTWLCLSASIICMGPILYCIHKYSPIYEYKGIGIRGGLSSVENCIWYMYGALLQQGGMHLPQADSARILVGAWWLVVLVVATTYCGNLVAFLTFPKIDIPITTVEELLAHRDTVTWSMTKDSFLVDQLKMTPEWKYRRLYEGRRDVAKSREMIEKIANGKHVFIDWKIRLQYIMKKQYLESDRCDLALGLDEFFDEQLALIVSQDTPYLEIINDEIKKLHQVGLIQKWLTNYLPKKDRCWKNRHIIEVNNHTVNMDDMQGSFFILFLGFMLSVLIIAVEKLWHNHKVKRKDEVIQPFTT